MSEFDSFLDETLEAWRGVRSLTVSELQNIPTGQLDFRPSPEVKNVRELIQHILELPMIMAAELPRPDTDLRRLPWPKMARKYAKALYRSKTKKELLSLLRSQMKDMERAFRKAGDLSQWQFMERFDGKMGTKFQWIHHGIAHEMYHAGQLATYVRLMGRVPALTQQMAKRKK